MQRIQTLQGRRYLQATRVGDVRASPVDEPQAASQQQQQEKHTSPRVSAQNAGVPWNGKLGQQGGGVLTARRAHQRLLAA